MDAGWIYAMIAHRPFGRGRSSHRSCRPSNSPVGTIFGYCVTNLFVSCRPSNSPVGTIYVFATILKNESCRPSNSPVGTIAKCRSERTTSLAGLPIPQLVQWGLRPSTPLGGLAGLPIPQLVQCLNQKGPSEQGPFWYRSKKMQLWVLKSGLRTPFLEKRLPKIGSPISIRRC